ncbi:helicase associated domain-containing protein [Streptomyces atratus]|uniref:helicase associated domain-containing protein n=1 Tax=Streptomyces atratus TaxID=1893 RepID=UPI003657FCA4
MLESGLGLEPGGKNERGERVGRGHDAKWALNLAAAQFHAREGHLRVPRKHVEHLQAEAGTAGHQNGADGVVVVRLGTWIDNARRRGNNLTEQRRADLDVLGLRW